MDDLKRARRLLLLALISANFFVMGAAAPSMSVLLTPLVKHFGWTHARVSLLPTVFSTSLGLFGFAAGWMLDYAGARVTVGGGAAMAALGMLLASRAHGFGPMVTSYVLIGAGCAFSTWVPAAVLSANWFGDKRGLATGALAAGTAGGAIILAPLTDYLVSNHGIPATYVTLASLILVFCVPPCLMFLRTRPPGAVHQTVAQEIAALPGLELGEALRNRAYWSIVLVTVLSMAATNGQFSHLVSFLIWSGYSSRNAALVISAHNAVGVAGFAWLGACADRFTGRRVLPVALLAQAAMALLLLGAGGGRYWPICLTGFVLLFGVVSVTGLIVSPVAAAEVVGLKRFAPLSGILMFLGNLGLAGGPFMVGLVFDLTGSYARSFVICSMFGLVGALLALTIRRSAALAELSPEMIRAARRH